MASRNGKPSRSSTSVLVWAATYVPRSTQLTLCPNTSQSNDAENATPPNRVKLGKTSSQNSDCFEPKLRAPTVHLFRSTINCSPLLATFQAVRKQLQRRTSSTLHVLENSSNRGSLRGGVGAWSGPECVTREARYGPYGVGA